MKEKLSLSLTGNQWWKPFLAYILLLLATIIPLEFAFMKLDSHLTGLYLMSTVSFCLVMTALLAIVEAAFAVIMSRIVYPTFSIRGKTFVYTGKMREFVKLYLIHFLLSIVTLGIYAPWFTKRITDYQLRHTEYDGIQVKFLSTGRRLFVYYLLAMFIPIVIWALAFTGITGMIASAPSTTSNAILGLEILAVAIYMLLFVVLVPFVYLEYKWYFNFEWKNISLVWDTKFWPSCFYLIGQVLLTIITLGIYWPLMIIKTWRYFADKTVILEGDKEKIRFGFEGNLRGGFVLLWGQTLLCIITLGLYIPWAYANCARYFVNNTYFEENVILIGET